jgi:hypothetical protein
MSHRLLPALLLPTLLGVSSTHAQRFPLSLDGTLGWATGRTSGTYRGTGEGFGVDAVLAWRLEPIWSGTFVVASGRPTLIPNFNNDAFHLVALSLGLRIGH